VAQDHLRFEPLNHRIGKGVYQVPLLVDENRNPFHPYTEPLLRAAEIIAPRLGKEAGQLAVGSLVEKVGTLLEISDKTEESTDKIEGLIIEGDEGEGAIQIKPDTSLISRRDGDEYLVPSAAFLEMLRSWQRQK